MVFALRSGGGRLSHMPPVRAAAIEQKQPCPGQIYQRCAPERQPEAKCLRQRPAQQRAEPCAYIPGDKEGRIRPIAFKLQSIFPKSVQICNRTAKLHAFTPWHTSLLTFGKLPGGASAMGAEPGNKARAEGGES